MKNGSVVTALLFGAAMIVGCGDSTRPADSPPIRLVAGADASDTVRSILTQALVVEVNDAGGPLPGAVVRFQSVPADANATWRGAGAYVSPLDRNQFGTFLSDTTDENGRAYALVQLGQVAGTAAVVLTVPDIGAEDTAHFTVKAGSPVSVVVLPQDTALYVGASFTPRASAVDAFQNPTEADVSFRTVGSAISYTDGKVKALRLGSGQFIATFGAQSSTAQVEVVPEMTFGAIRGDGAVVMANADGSAYRVLVPAIQGNGPFTTDWDPAGKLLAYDERYGSGNINTVDLEGTVNTIGAIEQYGLYPEFSPDGAWVYYAGLQGDFATYRAHTDGSGDEALTINSQPNAVSPSPAPDGERLVFSTGDWGQLAIVDIATGEWSYVDGAMGTSPAWSPDGSRIAYVATGNDGARLHTVAPDGSDDHRVGDEASSYDVGIDWSPDGKWIIARNNSHGYLELIDLAAGVTYPLPYTGGYRGPSWKP
jgi:Tol biopolymer transport system component